MKGAHGFAIGVVCVSLGVLAGWGIFAPKKRGATLSGPGIAQNAGAFKNTLTIATYNVKNFFDEWNNPYTSDEGTGEKPAAEVAALAEAIRAVNADVIVLQEVEAGAMLRTFVRERLAGMKYAYVADTVSEDPRGITVAALSRVPVVRITSHRLVSLEEAGSASGENRFARDLLQVDVEARPGHLISVYGVHLKSKRTDPDSKDKQSNGKRLAEGKRIRELIRAEQPAGARFVFLGDCNDYIDAPPVKEIRAATEPEMVDALAGIPVAERITFKNDRYTEAIDQILLSPALAADFVEGSAGIFSGGVFEKASDHRPVRVTVRVP